MQRVYGRRSACFEVCLSSSDSNTKSASYRLNVAVTSSGRWRKGIECRLLPVGVDVQTTDRSVVCCTIASARLLTDDGNHCRKVWHRRWIHCLKSDWYVCRRVRTRSSVTSLEIGNVISSELTEWIGDKPLFSVRIVIITCSRQRESAHTPSIMTGQISQKGLRHQSVTFNLATNV